jgi:uncharacterized membrane protein
VDRLLAAGHPVVPVHPTAFWAARERWGASGAKSDAGDSYKLADYLRTDGHRLAIAITLLVIEIHPPELGEGETLAQALWAQWPNYVAYLVSFLTIGVIWLNHHRVFDQVARIDGPLLLLNLNLLLWTALIPFPTAVVAQHLRDGGEAARTAAALYCGVLLLMGLAFGGLFAWVTHTDRLLGRLPPPEVIRAARRRFMLGLAVYATAFALSWASAPLALALCGLMALYYAFDQASVRKRSSLEKR